MILLPIWSATTQDRTLDKDGTKFIETWTAVAALLDFILVYNLMVSYAYERPRH